MSHVPPLSLDDAPEAARPILEATEKKFGKLLNIFATAAYQPDVLGGMTQINDGIDAGLPAKFRELAYYKASQLNDCKYCSHYHKQAAEKAGLSAEQLDAIPVYEASDLFDEQEKAILDYTAELTRKSDVSDRVVAAVKEFLSDEQLVALAATVGLANFTNRFNHGLGIELP